MTQPNRPATEVIDSATGLALEPGGTETMVMMVSDLPEIDPDEAVERILNTSLTAKSAADLNTPWETAGRPADSQGLFRSAADLAVSEVQGCAPPPRRGRSREDR